MKNQLTHHKQKLSNCLVAVSLFLSVFVFSPYVDNSQSQQEQTTKTEQLYTKNSKCFKRTFVFKKAFQSSDISKFELTNSEVSTLFAYTLLIKVKFDNSVKLYNSIKTFHQFIQAKTIPESSTELDSPSITG